MNYLINLETVFLKIQIKSLLASFPLKMTRGVGPFELIPPNKRKLNGCLGFPTLKFLSPTLVHLSI
jgi:hypothetical protein